MCEQCLNKFSRRNSDMPRLRKQSAQQRQRLTASRVNSYRERNPMDLLRNASALSTRRQNVDIREESFRL